LLGSVSAFSLSASACALNQTARDLQEGREVGRIGYYTLEVTIRKNLIVSIDRPWIFLLQGEVRSAGRGTSGTMTSSAPPTSFRSDR
jgi:hypothetical protein